MKAYRTKLAAWNKRKQEYEKSKSDAIHFWVSQLAEGGSIEITADVSIKTGDADISIPIGIIRTEVNRQNTNKPSVSQAFQFLCSDIAARLNGTSVFPSESPK